jgi:hypothetical protein
MPQLDFVSFHYILNILSVSYLFVYVAATLFLLKPIFAEFYLGDKYPIAAFSGWMLTFLMCSNKVVFSRVPKQTPSLLELKKRVRKRWDWLKYTPRIKRVMYVPRKVLCFG